MSNRAKPHDSYVRPWYKRHRRPLIFTLVALVILAAMGFFAIKVAKSRGLYSACDESVWSRIWRAAEMSIQARGTTALALAIAFLLWIAMDVGRTFHAAEGDWKHKLRSTWKANSTKTILGLVVWLGLITYYVASMPPPTFSRVQIADFSQAVVVDVTFPSPSNQRLLGSGFWIDSKGYVLTSSDKQRNQLGIGTMLPPLFGSTLTSTQGMVTAYGRSDYYDPDSTLEIVWVPDSPFTRKLHQLAISIDAKTGTVERTDERYAVPCLCSENVAVGESIFLAGVERSEDQQSEVSVFAPGVVTKIGGDAKRNRMRIYTDLRFKPSYQGAAVLDLSKHVMGIVINGDDAGNAVLVPARYVREALAAAGSVMK